ncbi:hypothetical protein GCM10023317_76280 [Actinopolymorpha pittospori]
MSEYTERFGAWEWPSASDLPEIELLRSQDWHLAEQDMVIMLSMWWAEHRGWVRDRTPSVWGSVEEPAGRTRWKPWRRRRDALSMLVPQTDAEREFDVDRLELSGTCEEAGLPVPPQRQWLWLMRSPFVDVSVPQMYDALSSHAHRRARERGLSDYYDDKSIFVEVCREVIGSDRAAFETWWAHNHL